MGATSTSQARTAPARKPRLGVSHEIVGVFWSWWSLVAGGVLGVLAIITLIENSRLSPWLWVSFGLAFLSVVLIIRLAILVSRQNNMRRETIITLEGYCDAFERLSTEAPAASTPIPETFQEKANDLVADVRKVLRREADGFLPYWSSDHPDPRSAAGAVPPDTKAWVEAGLAQLREIVGWIREGRDEPPSAAPTPH